MAYPKITVNTGLTIAVIASDTIPIPDPGLPQLTGRTTGTTGGKLIDASENFETNGVVIGDIVYNTTDSTVTTITAIDSADTLSVASNIFSTDENYIIFQGGPLASERIASSEGCLLYVGSKADIKQDVGNVAAGFTDPRYIDIRVKTVAGNDITFTNFKVGSYLPVQVVQVYEAQTDTDVVNNTIGIW